MDNKSDIKFNKRLITNQGATYWVNQKNAKIPNTANNWAAYTTDINKDDVQEVVKLTAMETLSISMVGIWLKQSMVFIKFIKNLLKIMVLSHQMVFFECLFSKSRRPFHFYFLQYSKSHHFLKGK